jgi:hypothetical protein
MRTQFFITNGEVKVTRPGLVKVIEAATASFEAGYDVYVWEKPFGDMVAAAHSVNRDSGKPWSNADHAKWRTFPTLSDALKQRYRCLQEVTSQ